MGRDYEDSREVAWEEWERGVVSVSACTAKYGMCGRETAVSCCGLFNVIAKLEEKTPHLYTESDSVPA